MSLEEAGRGLRRRSKERPSLRGIRDTSPSEWRLNRLRLAATGNSMPSAATTSSARLFRSKIPRGEEGRRAVRQALGLAVRDHRLRSDRSSGLRSGVRGSGGGASAHTDATRVDVVRLPFPSAPPTSSAAGGLHRRRCRPSSCFGATVIARS